jgi:hypothetical protein
MHFNPEDGGSTVIRNIGKASVNHDFKIQELTVILKNMFSLITLVT